MERKYILILLLSVLFSHFQIGIDSVQLNHVTIISPKVSLDQHLQIERKNGFYFFKCAVAGAISCSATHSALVPLDVIKTKIQTDIRLQSKKFADVFSAILFDGGPKNLIRGLGATSSGYFLQGACKFGFYEYFKNNFNNKLISLKIDPSTSWRLPVLFSSSALAELVASWALCPLEVTRIYMVTNKNHQSTLQSMNHIIQKQGISGLFAGMNLILLRQIPYTCAKLAGYELISEKLDIALRKTFFFSHYKKDERITIAPLLSGILAGMLAAVVSHPADVLLSKSCHLIANGVPGLAGGASTASKRSVITSLRQLGFRGCYSGLAPRALMVGSITAGQFFIYENIKEYILRKTPPPPLSDTKLSADHNKYVVEEK